MIQISDSDRVRVLTFDRTEALNAFNEALYDATAAALIGAAADDDVSVVVMTGRGRAFSAGADLKEMAARNTGDPSFAPGEHGFPGLIAHLLDFPKPLLCAVNGLGLGIGATILGYADLAFMADDARLKCPFTELGVAPEAASSFLFPRLMGTQNAAWMLLSSEWFSAQECQEMGLVWKVTAPDDLLDTTMAHARHLASQPLASLVETKQLLMAPVRDEILAARRREDGAFARLLGGDANADALAAFAERD